MFSIKKQTAPIAETSPPMARQAPHWQGPEQTQLETDTHTNEKEILVVLRL